MENQLDNGFCPQCGALLRDGECPSCGYGAGQNPGQTYGDQTDGAVESAGGTQPAGEMQPRNYERYQSSMNNNMYYQSDNGSQQQQEYMYYQQPGANYYNNQQAPEKKKSKTGVVIAVIIALVLVVALIIAVVFLTFSAMKSVSGVEENRSYTYEDDFGNDFSFDEDVSDDGGNVWDSGVWDTYEGDGYDEDLLAFVDDIDWDDTSWMEEPENYTPEEVYDDYYECYIGYANCIDENVPYQMVHNNWEELDEEKNVCIRVNYYQLEGDIPNLDEINEELRFQAAWPGDNYLDYMDDFEEEFNEYGPGYVVYVDSYVTYNDEEKISVVSDIYYESATSLRNLLYGVNIDLKTGEIMKNNRMLDISDEFLEEYKEICEYQNGTISVFDELDNDELREFFEDRDAVIIYFTPCGLEVGINYETEERYGWVSATLTDYEQYLR